MTLLVEFPVIRKGDFGDDSPDGAFLKHNGGIEDAPFETDGRSDDDYSLRSGAGSRDLLECVFTLLKKMRLKKQVPARVSRERQFGEKNDGSVVLDALEMLFPSEAKMNSRWMEKLQYSGQREYCQRTGTYR